MEVQNRNATADRECDSIGETVPTSTYRLKEPDFGKFGFSKSRSRKQTYLGLHIKQVDAAKAYDSAAVCLYGAKAKTNYPLTDYKDELEAFAARPAETQMQRV
jgi:hypothetical protein